MIAKRSNETATFAINGLLKKGVIPALACAALLIASAGAAEVTPEQKEAIKSEVSKEFKGLHERVDELEKQNTKVKLLKLSSDIDFLEELVFSDDKAKRIFDNSTLLNLPGCETVAAGGGSLYAEAIKGGAVGTVLRGGQRKVVYFKAYSVQSENGKTLQLASISPDQANLVTPDLKCRLALIENQLFNSEKLAATQKLNLKGRVGEAYAELNFPKWNQENLRFGANVGYLQKTGVQTASVAFHVFPSYRHHTPGNLDFWRRASFFLGVGNVFSGSGNEIDVESAVLSTGIGVELIRGVSLNYGISVFDGEKSDSNKTERIREKGISVSMRSEFWSSLFGNGANK